MPSVKSASFSASVLPRIVQYGQGLSYFMDVFNWGFSKHDNNIEIGQCTRPLNPG